MQLYSELFKLNECTPKITQQIINAPNTIFLISLSIKRYTPIIPVRE